MTMTPTPLPTNFSAMPLPENVRQAAEAISEAFHAAITLWREEQAGEWSYVAELRRDQTNVAGPKEVDSSTLIQAADSGEPRLTKGSFQQVLLAPLPAIEGRRIVGAVVQTLSSEEQASRITADAIAREKLFQQVETLYTENDSFALQLTSDLEELSFLRTVVDRMGTSAADAGLATMAKKTLPVLNTSVRAETLALVTISASAGDEDPEGSKPGEGHLGIACQIGDARPLAELHELVDRFKAEAQSDPLVRNWGGDAISVGAPAPHGVQSLIVTPLHAGARQWGWLIAINRARCVEGQWESSWQLNSEEFGSGEATLMTTTASILAMQAANLEMLREKEQIMVNVVRSLVSAIEAKDPYTRGHSERVALYTRRLAQEVGYLEGEAERIYLAALLHDVGKIGVSDATLKKPGKLTSEEYAEISKHPDEGWAILCDLQQLRYVLPGVLHHHERWDGRGYPDGLAGKAIPQDGRVMAVADAYDAMTSDRPYRDGMPCEKAESILREGAGVQWDPECVESFFACLDDIHEIKRQYHQRQRRLCKEVTTEEEVFELPHEVTGLPS